MLAKMSIEFSFLTPIKVKASVSFVVIANFPTSYLCFSLDICSRSVGCWAGFYLLAKIDDVDQSQSQKLCFHFEAICNFD